MVNDETRVLFQTKRDNSTVPVLIKTTIGDLVFIFGEDQVKQWISDGTVKIVGKENADS